METTQNPSTEVTQPRKQVYETIEASIAKMKLTFNNAMLPEIFDVMLTVGYTTEKIELLKADLAQLEVLCQTQTKEAADKYNETDKFNIKKAEVDSIFSTHRGLLRILFKENIHALKALRLDESMPRTYSAWFQMVSNFYSQLAETPGILTKATAVGITEAKVAAQKQALAELQSLKESQSKESAEAQAATDARDKAFDALYPQYTEYIKYAKILLAGNQALEAIGVKVK
jgi:hypothetical protein